MVGTGGHQPEGVLEGCGQGNSAFGGGKGLPHNSVGMEYACHDPRVYTVLGCTHTSARCFSPKPS